MTVYVIVRRGTDEVIGVYSSYEKAKDVIHQCRTSEEPFAEFWSYIIHPTEVDEEGGVL